MAVNYDTDGTEWMTVRFTIDVQVMASEEEEAVYFATLALPDYFHPAVIAETAEVL